MFEKRKVKKDLNSRQNQLNEVNREYCERTIEKKRIENDIISLQKEKSKLQEELGILKEMKITKDMIDSLKSEISLLEERKQLLLQEGMPKYKISDILFVIYTHKNFNGYYLGAFSFKGIARLGNIYTCELNEYLSYQSIVGNHFIALDPKTKEAKNKADEIGYDLEVKDIISLEDLCLQINSDIMYMQEITHSEVLQILQYLNEKFEKDKKFCLMINQIKIEQKYTTNKLTLKRINN